MKLPDLRAGSGLGAALAGMALIAATYGMARFGVGLFAPLLAAERPQLAGVLGWAAAAQFSAYCVAAVVAARLVDRHPRTGLLLAGLTATAGCVGVALASTPATFVAAVLIGGMGGGFASPALVPIIDAVVAPAASATAQSVVNAGTAVGVIGAGLTAFAAASIGPAWAVMALICAATTAAAWYPVRNADLACRPNPASGHGAPSSSPEGWKALVQPGIAAVVAGIGSALIWTFGPLLVTEAGAVAAGRTGWLWIALGAGGFLGALAGTLVRRTGRRPGWLICAAALAAANAALAVAVSAGNAWAAYAAMAVFGAGYMGLSAVLILWARQVRRNNPGAGTSILFIALAVGQALGSAGFGVVRDQLPPVLLAGVAAGLCLAGGLSAIRRAGRRGGAERPAPAPAS